MSLDTDNMSNTETDETLDQLFTRLKAEDIEQFYMAYQLWSQRQQIEQLQLQMFALQRKIDENAASMEQFQPSAVALASLAQLQACGVEDTDLLDRMLERGEEWLDHSIQLLERCEQLDLIGGDYTQWCEHALEGAYDWIDSMTDPNLQEVSSPPSEQQESTSESTVTEEQLLRKLMSDDDGDEQKVVPEQKQRITQPLPGVDEQASVKEDTAQTMAVHLTNIEEHETTLPESTEQTRAVTPLSSEATHGEETKEVEAASNNQTTQNSNGTAVENRAEARSQLQQHPQNIPSSKKRASKAKKGFLLSLLSKFRKKVRR